MVVGGVVGMEGALKVKHRHAQAHTHTVSQSKSAPVEHQSLLDIVGGHTCKRFTLYETWRGAGS